MWRIRYDEPSKNYKEEYWNGDIFLDELLEDIIVAVTQKNVHPFDIIIQDLDGAYDETIENEDDREEIYSMAELVSYIENNEHVFLEDESLLEKLKEIPQVRELLKEQMYF